MSNFLTEEYVRQLFEESGIYWCDESKYVDSRTPVVALSSDGYKVLARIADLRRNYGVRAFYKSNPYTINNIKMWCEKNTSDITLVEGQLYVDAKGFLKFNCLKCGSVFEATWDDIHSNRGCAYCKGKRVNETNSIYSLRPDLVKFFKNKDDSKNRTCGSDKKIIVRCPLCEFEKLMSPSDLTKRGFSCNKCNPDFGITRTNEVYSVIQANRNKAKWSDKFTKLYIVKMFDEFEYFYKIGIGVKGAKKRFADKCDIKYDYEIICEYDFTLYDGIKIEHILHDYFHIYKYKPNIKFKGYTECFSEINLDKIKLIIDEYKTEE